jgi:hypothetical protein
MSAAALLDIERKRAMDMLPPLALTAALTANQLSALAFAGAIILVVATAWVMKRLERAKREQTEKEIGTLTRTAETESAKIIAWSSVPRKNASASGRT